MIPFFCVCLSLHAQTRNAETATNETVATKAFPTEQSQLNEKTRRSETGEHRADDDRAVYVENHPTPPVPEVAIDRKIVNAVMDNNYDLIDPATLQSFTHDFDMWLSAAPSNYTRLDERQTALYEARNYKELYMYALKTTILADKSYRAMIDTPEK